MAEEPTPAEPPAPVEPAADVEPAGRGRLTIAPKVYEHIASIAATEVGGVAPPEAGSVDRLLGRTLPRVSSAVAGDRLKLRAQVAAVWPAPLPSVAAQVRERVALRVRELTGEAVDTVDVSVSRTVRAGSTGAAAGGDAVDEAPDSPSAPTDPSAPSSPTGRAARAARAPRGPTPAVAVGLLVSLALIALGLVAVRDALLAAGAIHGSPWLVSGVARVRRQGPGAEVGWLAVAAVVLGIILLVLSLGRRSRPAAVLASATGVHLGRRDVSRIAAAIAHDVPGVLSAGAVTGSRRVTVRVSATGVDPGIGDAVTAAVAAGLAAVEHPAGGPFEVRTVSRREG